MGTIFLKEFKNTKLLFLQVLRRTQLWGKAIFKKKIKNRFLQVLRRAQVWGKAIFYYRKVICPVSILSSEWAWILQLGYFIFGLPSKFCLTYSFMNCLWHITLDSSFSATNLSTSVSMIVRRIAFDVMYEYLAKFIYHFTIFYHRKEICPPLPTPVQWIVSD